MSVTMMISAMMPTAALIALGVFLRRSFNYVEVFWRDIERLTYYLLLPALFISSLARVDFTSIEWGRMALVLAISATAAAIIGLAARPFSGTDGPGFTSVFQGTVRFNNYVGAVIASALFGVEGLALAALCNAVLVPIVNIYSTLVLSRWGAMRMRGYDIVKAVATNPLVGACLIGISLNLAGHTQPGSAVMNWPATGTGITLFGTVLKLIGQAALPIGLLCVGAGLHRPETTLEAAKPLATAVITRLLIVPAIACGLAYAFGLKGHTAVVSVLFLALPTASSSYVLARRLGGDAPLAAAIIAVQTVIAMGTLPVWIWVASSTFNR